MHSSTRKNARLDACLMHGNEGPDIRGVAQKGKGSDHLLNLLQEKSDAGTLIDKRKRETLADALLENGRGKYEI